MAVRQIQSTFSYGELDPKLFGKTDFAGYFKGAQKLRNIIVTPEGAAKRRFGTKYGFTIVDTGDTDEPITDSTEVNGVIFDYSQTKAFLVVVRPHDRTGTAAVAFDIYLDDVLKSTETTTDYAITDIANLNFLRAQDRIIVLHKSIQPKQLVRGATDADWDLTNITFSDVPVYDFSIADGVSYRGASDTFTPSAVTGTGITLTGSSAFFTAGHVGGLFIGAGGIFRITAVNAGGTVATGDTFEDFDGVAAIKGKYSILLGAAWGNFTGGTPAGKDRGWPSLGTFFQQRMFLANSLTLPNLIWGSNSGDFYNFDDSGSTALDGFSLGLGSDGNEEVQAIVGTKALMALGFSGAFSTSLFIDQPISPSNAFLNEQARDGSAAIPAQVVDNQVFYIDENEKKVRVALYDIATSSFNVTDASILSSQIINTPVTTAAYRPSTEDGSFYMLNNADGTLAIFQSLLSQSINAWTLAETRGSIERLLSSRDTGYLVVRRTISTGATVTGNASNIYTSNADFEAYVDVTTAAQSSATDLPFFTNENDYLIVGHESPFYRIAVVLDTAANVSVLPTFEYLNKLGTWVEFTPTDGTTGFTGNGEISWDLDADTPNWFPQDLEKITKVSLPEDSVAPPITKFWMRMRRTEATVTTTPVEETILFNIADRLYLESIDFDRYMDSSEPTTTSDANGLVTGLGHLLGQQVYVRADSVPMGPYFVNASGEITINALSSSDVDVGLNYIPVIEPMPVVAEQAFTQTVYQPKHVKSIYVDYYKSLGILVNGSEIATLKLNQFVLDQTPVPTTGFAEYTPMRGWDPRATNTISQELPLPMTIIGIGYRVEVS